MHSFLFGKLCFQRSVKSWCLSIYLLIYFCIVLLRKVFKYEISVIFLFGVPLQAIYWKIYTEQQEIHFHRTNCL